MSRFYMHSQVKDNLFNLKAVNKAIGWYCRLRAQNSWMFIESRTGACVFYVMKLSHRYVKFVLVWMEIQTILWWQQRWYMGVYYDSVLPLVLEDEMFRNLIMKNFLRAKSIFSLSFWSKNVLKNIASSSTYPVTCNYRLQADWQVYTCPIQFHV